MYRRSFIVLLILTIFSTCFYFLAISNDEICKENKIIRFFCESFNDASNKIRKASKKVSKHVSDGLAKSLHKVKEMFKVSSDDVDVDIFNNVTIGKLEILQPHITTQTASPIRWIDMSEGKKYSDYGDNTCEDNEHRRILTSIFQKWTKMAASLNITYFLTCGTLLGAWRNGDIIPYDSDMDVIIDSRDNIKLEAIKSKRNFSPYDGKLRFVMQEDWRRPYDDRRRFTCDGELVPSYSGECSFQEPLGRVSKDGLHLDVYDYKLENGKLYDPSEFKKEFSATDVFPLRKCKFLGFDTFCPKKPTAVLYEFYGDINQLHPNTICKNKDWVKRTKR